MGWFWRLVAFFFCREPEQIAISGGMLTENQVSQLEARLQKCSGDLRSRCRVLGYMTQHRFMDPKMAQRRVEHVLWLIEHRPETTFTGSPFCRVMTQEPGYDRVRAAWDRVLAAPDAKPAVIMNAARGFSPPPPNGRRRSEPTSSAESRWHGWGRTVEDHPRVPPRT
jgi:hypothetical protein